MATARPLVREARLAAGLTQQQLAELMAVPQPVIARWETGDREPRVYAAVRLAAALNTNVECLFAPDETKRPPRCWNSRGHGPKEKSLVSTQKPTRVHVEPDEVIEVWREDDTICIAAHDVILMIGTAAEVDRLVADRSRLR